MSESDERKKMIAEFVKAIKDGELTEEDLEATSGAGVHTVHYDRRYDFKTDAGPDDIQRER